ncbi:MAG: hypothetical protein COV52_00030 [Gammaproteobacteria bacterium CG11_big_fil_rev_8_21_14_0_20_46_22]|nr:MAG: hypothetical protein COW05_02575 [Gammaproteobacteria bacterium CG12_big_fil_rev_8_21_14_0_65_46_12]PIR12192.1 MAG: hypothetical protein COV52_00030 [Gammaproteobacteria bacterium CG11_big_fil_rev_8_21_14_0_20_46_22]
MLTSKEQLLKEARTAGYKPEMLEKVYRLLDIFQQILSVPYLKERLVLKGGTALNLFHFEHLPRLSVDIDLNYIGAIDRETMLTEKPVIVDAVHQILIQNQFERHRSPIYHAGGKMVWFYNSVLGQRGALEIDLNFMYRQPLYPIVDCSPKLESHAHWQAPILDIHELAAGKLSALFSRSVSRDLFDAHYLLTKTDLNTKKLREAFIVYLAMTTIDLDSLAAETVTYNLTDLKNRLLPVMHQQSLARTLPQLKQWATSMVTELQQALSAILPLQDKEQAFIQAIRTAGKITPELITDDKAFAEKIMTHPAIQWAVKRSMEVR